MTKFDKDYLELCKKILTEGVEVENRTGINTIKIPYHTLEYDLSKEFPILQSKQIFYEKAIIEMLWIWQMQSNNVKELKDRGVKIWNEWMVDEDGIYRVYEPISSNYDPEKKVPVTVNVIVDENDIYGKELPMLDSDGNLMYAKSLIPGKNIKSARYFGKEYAFTIGTGYGFFMKKFKSPQNLIYKLKNTPNDRRMVISILQDEYLRTAVLPPCVWSTEWDVTSGKLNLIVHQRSCDVALGLPFNVTQYATLLMMIAQVTGYEPGMVIFTIKDAHIYVTHVDGIKDQLKRWQEYEEFLKKPKSILEINKRGIENALSRESNGETEQEEEMRRDLRAIELALETKKPELILNREIKDFFKFDNSKECKDAKMINYKHLGKIKFPIAQ